jgi:hypothetical protein
MCQAQKGSPLALSLTLPGLCIAPAASPNPTTTGLQDARDPALQANLARVLSG